MRAIKECWSTRIGNHEGDEVKGQYCLVCGQNTLPGERLRVPHEDMQDAILAAKEEANG